MPLSTLHPVPHGAQRKTRGQDGSLLLSCGALSSPTARRFIPTIALPRGRGSVKAAGVDLSLRTGGGISKIANLCYAHGRVSTCNTNLRGTVENFIAAAAQPSLLDSGEEPLRLVPGQWEIREWNGRLILEAWDGQRSLVRKIVRLAEQRRDRLSLVTERFPKAED